MITDNVIANWTVFDYVLILLILKIYFEEDKYVGYHLNCSIA